MKLAAICVLIFLSYQVSGQENINFPKSIQHYKNENHNLRGELIRNQHKSSSSSDKNSNTVTDFITGILLFIASFPILWLNERKLIVNDFRIKNAQKDCIQIDNKYVDTSNEGKLVYTSGTSTTNETTTDEDFAVSEHLVYKIVRRVEMYQWIENSERSLNGEYTYTYKQSWVDHEIESSNFYHSQGHENDQSKWCVKKKIIYCQNVSLGAYLLNDSQKEQTRNYEAIPITQINLQKAQSFLGRPHQQIVQENNCIKYLQYPNISTSGDIKVYFEKVPCGIISIIAKQEQNKFTPFIIHDKYDDDPNHPGCCDCREIGLCREIQKMERPITDIDWVYEKEISRQDIFTDKFAESHHEVLITRICGWLIMALGLFLILTPIPAFFNFIPLLGPAIGNCVGFILLIASIIITLPLAILTISLAWLWYRPIVAFALFAISGMVTFAIYFYLKNYQKPE